MFSFILEDELNESSIYILTLQINFFHFKLHR